MQYLAVVLASFFVATLAKCPGILLDYPLTGALSDYRVSDFNVISHGNFRGKHGDVESRLLVGGNAYLADGFSVGMEIDSRYGPDNRLPFSMIVGGDLCWYHGSLFPDGREHPKASPIEYLRLTGQAPEHCVPEYLQERIGAGYPYSSINDEMDQLFGDLRDVSEELKSCSHGSWATYREQYGGLFISGPAHPNYNRYCLRVSVHDWNKYSWYVFDDLDPLAEWVITLYNDDSTTTDTTLVFECAQWPAIADNTIFNIAISNPVEIRGGHRGHILAPYSTYAQPYGVTHGTVIAKEITHLVQANRPHCNYCGCCDLCIFDEDKPMTPATFETHPTTAAHSYPKSNSEMNPTTEKPATHYNKKLDVRQ